MFIRPNKARDIFIIETLRSQKQPNFFIGGKEIIVRTSGNWSQFRRSTVRVSHHHQATVYTTQRPVSLWLSMLMFHEKEPERVYFRHTFSVACCGHLAHQGFSLVFRYKYYWGSAKSPIYLFIYLFCMVIWLLTSTHIAKMLVRTPLQPNFLC